MEVHSTIGGFTMLRSYRDIEEYEKEISELREKGLAKREIGEKFGFFKSQIKGLSKRKRSQEEKLSCGITPRK